MNKIRRQLFDMQAAGSSSDGREDISVEGLAPAAYLERFTWNEAKYPPRRPLKETVDTITETIQKLEDDLKVFAMHNILHQLAMRLINQGKSHLSYQEALASFITQQAATLLLYNAVNALNSQQNVVHHLEATGLLPLA